MARSTKNAIDVNGIGTVIDGNAIITLDK